MGTEKYGKRRQVSFRISALADEKLAQVAALFDMEPSQYAKAVLYRDLGIFSEPLDHRKRVRPLQKSRSEFIGDKAAALSEEN